MHGQGYRFGLLLMVVLLLCGCAAGSRDDLDQSGFLVDYSQLTPGGEDRAALRYVKQGVDFKQYDALMFDRVSVWLSPEAENRDVDPAVFKIMSDYFLDSLVKAVEDGYTVVDQPGPNVIRVRAAITDVEPSDPVAKALSVDNIGTGGAEAEIELLDSMSSERLAAAVDRHPGGQPASRDVWEDTRAAFDYWARRFRVRLDEARR